MFHRKKKEKKQQNIFCWLRRWSIQQKKRNTVHHGKALNSEWIIMHLLFYFWSRRQTTRYRQRKFTTTQTHIQQKIAHHNTLCESAFPVSTHFSFVYVYARYTHSVHARVCSANTVWTNRSELKRVRLWWGNHRLAMATNNTNCVGKLSGNWCIDRNARKREVERKLSGNGRHFYK